MLQYSRQAHNQEPPHVKPVRALFGPTLPGEGVMGKTEVEVCESPALRCTAQRFLSYVPLGADKTGVHTMENLKKHRVSPYVTIRRNCEDITLSEISQSQKDRYCMISLVCVSDGLKLTETEENGGR